jgi:hypothetical protein
MPGFGQRPRAMAEARAILQERLAPVSAERGLGTKIHERFAGVGALDIPDRKGETGPVQAY